MSLKKSYIVILFLSVSVANAESTLKMQMEYHLSNFKKMVSGSNTVSTRKLASEHVDYVKRIEALQFFSQHIYQGAQKAFWSEGAPQTKGESEQIKKMLQAQFKYFLPLYEEELVAESTEVKANLDLTKIQYRHMLKEILVESARSNVEAAQAYLSARRLSEGYASHRAEAEILAALCFSSPKCTNEATPHESLALKSIMSNDDQQTPLSLSQLERLPAEKGANASIVSYQEAEAQALGKAERTISSEKP